MALKVEITLKILVYIYLSKIGLLSYWLELRISINNAELQEELNILVDTTMYLKKVEMSKKWILYIKTSITKRRSCHPLA